MNKKEGQVTMSTMNATITLNPVELARRKRIRTLFTALRFLLILIFLAIFLFPVNWIAIGAFKGEGEFYHYPANLLARALRLGKLRPCVDDIRRRAGAALPASSLR